MGNHDDHPAVPPDVVLTPAAVAERLGVAVATLRSWDHRHGLGPTGHRAGRHRRYTAGDLRRLERVVDLIRQGVTVASAAAAVAAVPTAMPEGRRPRSAGLPALRAAAERLDRSAVEGAVSGLLDECGTVDAWQRLLVPFLVDLGERCCAAPDGPVEVEHVVTAAVLGALRRPPPPGRPAVLLACAPDEQHTLPIEALGRALTECGVGSLSLGARVPAPALLAAARRTGADHVVVWAHTPRLAWAVPLEELRRLPAVVVAAGPGWSGTRLPDAVHHPASLAEALALLTAPI